jgi:trans-aconitate methyltransferase
MELSTAIDLIKTAFAGAASHQAWVDLGSGNGLFTRALGEVIPAGGSITAIDKDSAILKSIEWTRKEIALIRNVGDFTSASFALPPADGILMANALHFASNQVALLTSLRKNLKADGKFILIEYDMDTPNAWVPYPLSFETLKRTASAAGFRAVKKIGETRSAYNRAMIYAALLQ